MSNYENEVLQVVTRLTVPFVQIYGIYIILHGHLSPGGGFAGGTILGTSMIMIALSFSSARGLEILPRERTKILESTGGLWFAMMGLVGLLFSKSYLTNHGVFPLGTPGTLFSSGLVLLLTLGIGTKVASTMITLFYQLLEEGDE